VRCLLHEFFSSRQLSCPCAVALNNCLFRQLVTLKRQSVYGKISRPILLTLCGRRVSSWHVTVTSVCRECALEHNDDTSCRLPYAPAVVDYILVRIRAIRYNTAHFCHPRHEKVCSRFRISILVYTVVIENTPSFKCLHHNRFKFLTTGRAEPLVYIINVYSSASW